MQGHSIRECICIFFHIRQLEEATSCTGSIKKAVLTHHWECPTWWVFPCCSTFSNMPALLLFPRLIVDHQMKNAASNAVKHPRCDISVLVFPICWAAWSDILYAWQPACRHGFQSSTAPGVGGHGYSVPPFQSHADGSDGEDSLSIQCIVNHPDSAGCRHRSPLCMVSQPMDFAKALALARSCSSGWDFPFS